MASEFRVVRKTFKDLESFLNSFETVYKGYYIYQILTEVAYNDSWAVVILCKKVI